MGKIEVDPNKSKEGCDICDASVQLRQWGIGMNLCIECYGNKAREAHKRPDVIMATVVVISRHSTNKVHAKAESGMPLCGSGRRKSQEVKDNGKNKVTCASCLSRVRANKKKGKRTTNANS